MDPLLEQLLAGFVDEAQEIYERVARSMMELEKAPAQGASSTSWRGGCTR